MRNIFSRQMITQVCFDQTLQNYFTTLWVIKIRFLLILTISLYVIAKLWNWKNLPFSHLDFAYEENCNRSW